MSRFNDIVTRLENVAKKLGLELEGAISILEGKHPTLTVVEKSENPTSSGDAAASAAQQNHDAAASTADAGIE